MKCNQSGFTATAAILTIVVLSIIGIVGYLIYDSRQGDKPSAAETSQTAEVDGSESERTVAEFYAGYEDLVPGPDTVTGEDTAEMRQDYVEERATQEYFEEYLEAQGADPVFCAQDLPESYSVTGSETNEDGSATVTVTQVWAYSGKRDLLVRVTAGQKIANITCPEF